MDDMYELLHHKISEIISVTDEEFEFCKTLFQPKKLRKKQFLLHEGDECRYTAFVEKGILRTFSIDEKGNEHILQFAMEGWWVADLYSFLTNEPSTYNIEALEECELLLITKPSWDLLFKKFLHLKNTSGSFYKIISSLLNEGLWAHSVNLRKRNMKNWLLLIRSICKNFLNI